MNLAYSKNKEFGKIFIQGVGFTKASFDEILEYIIRGLEKPDEKYYIVTPNPELLVIAAENIKYKKVLNDAKLALPDGIGVVLAGKILGRSIKHRISGVDFMEKVCEGVAEKPITIGFLGAGDGVAVKTADCLREKYPGLDIVFTYSGKADKETAQYLNDKITKKNLDILFVAFGSPKQELWIAENLDKLPVNIAVGVGGAFDFISGNVKRAPGWVRKIGFEWFFRLITQPWRIKRQLSLIIFIFLVLREFFSAKNSMRSTGLS